MTTTDFDRDHETEPTFALFADGGHESLHPTKEAAISHGRLLGVASFEVYDGDDRQVYSHRPQPRWA
jgi:hypothetical protein